MRRCAVIGSPIAHSLSPLLHRTAYACLGIADQFSYDAFEVTPDTLGDFIAAQRRQAVQAQIAELLRGWGVDLSERSIRLYLLQLDAEGWRKLTLRWGLFFFVLAALNELVWRTQTQDFWVAFKVWGVMPLT